MEMTRLKTGGMVFGMLALLLGVSCAGAPRREMKQASKAIEEAREMGAETYASSELQAVQELWNDMEAKIEAKDYETAKQLALQVEEQAKVLKKLAKARRAEARRDAMIALEGAQEAFEAVQAALDSAAALGASGKRLSEVKANSATMSAVLEEAQAAMDKGDFNAVIEQAKPVKDKASQLADEVMGAAEGAVLKADPDDPREVAVIGTTFGRIVFKFLPKDAPNHVTNFKKLAKMRFYNGTTFHRLIPGFMIQGGDPNTKDDNRANDGLGGPGYTIKAEFNARKHVRGTVSMARGPDPNSAGSQFFICVAPASHLDRSYTAFGQVTEGMDVVDKIMKVKKDRKGNPIKKVEMAVSIVDRAKAK